MHSGRNTEIHTSANGENNDSTSLPLYTRSSCIAVTFCFITERTALTRDGVASFEISRISRDSSNSSAPDNAPGELSPCKQTIYQIFSLAELPENRQATDRILTTENGSPSGNSVSMRKSIRQVSIGVISSRSSIDGRSSSRPPFRLHLRNILQSSDELVVRNDSCRVTALMLPFHSINVNDSCTMQSQKILSEVREELGIRRSKWAHLQAEWTPVYAKHVSDKPSRDSQHTYLNAVMASDFMNVNTRNSCLFRVALSRMTEPTSRDNQCGTAIGNDSPNAQTVGPVSGDKFSTELAATGLPSSTSQTMTDFSRFLFQLAGEAEFANAQDPVRALEKDELYRSSPRTESDRIIRRT